MNFLGVPGLASADDMRAFVGDMSAGGFQHVDDPSQQLWNRFGVTQQRTYVYINDDGTTEISGYGSLREDVQALIAN